MFGAKESVQERYAKQFPAEELILLRAVNRDQLFEAMEYAITKNAPLSKEQKETFGVLTVDDITKDQLV